MVSMASGVRLLSDVLLATKLYLPALRADLVRRPQLLARLDGGLQQGMRLLLVSAPAGYGKSTLVRAWVEHQRIPTAWLTLDEGDNDIVRFLHYLIAALRQVDPDLGLQALTILQTIPAPAAETVLTALVNDLAAVPRPRLVVLDDYHFITLSSIHQGVIFLAEHLPPQAHLVIASRADPPLSLPRLRSRNQIVEIRQIDLRFTTEEAAAFLSGRSGTALTAEQTQALNTCTEGWAAGLQLAALSLAQQSDIPAFIRNFAGSEHYILDYLLEEVLQRQPESIQQFLIFTSILNQMCASLCDALLQEHGEMPYTPSQAVLENLEHANLFIVPLDSHCTWYRYHHLFSDLLNQRLHRLYPQAIPGLHRAASAWYAQNDLIEDAIEHALAGGDEANAALLLEKSAGELLLRGEILTFQRWLAQIPLLEIRQRPTLGIYEAWAMMLRGEAMPAIESRLQHIVLEKDLVGVAAPLRMMLALLKGELDQATRLSFEALETLGEEESLLRNLAVMMRASIYDMKGETLSAIQVFEETKHESQRAGNRFVAGLVTCALAEECRKQGELRRAEAEYQQALELVTEAGGRRMPIASQVLAGLGELARERNELDLAEHLLQEGFELGEQWGHFRRILVNLNQARVLEAKGEFDRAIEILATLREISHSTRLTRTNELIVEFYAARLNLHMGRIDLAEEWARRRGFVGDLEKVKNTPIQEYGELRIRKYEYLVLARLWLQQGRPADALELLAEERNLAEQAVRPVLMMEADILAALAYLALGQAEQAGAALEPALVFGQAHGFLRIFLDEGHALAHLLAALRPRITDLEQLAYVDRLLAGFSSPAASMLSQPKLSSTRGPTLVPSRMETPSAREMEVMHLLASGLSTVEIASQLCISLNTLRTHLKSLYGKLDAHSRYEAIEQARQKGLL
jgi:LuxR family transcriptional regulator, maltose regulon positive regulatory protein